MAEFYEMPAVSPTMEVGTIVSWRVQEGQAFESGTVMAEVGTDKANMDAEVFDAGVLLKHLVEEGGEAPAGAPIAIIGESADEDISALIAEFKASQAAPAAAPAAAAAPEPAPAAAAPAPKPVAPPPPKRVTRKTTVEAPQRMYNGSVLSGQFMEPNLDIGAANVEERIPASPLARKIAAAKGLDLGRIQGTGPNGRIVKADVENAKLPAAGPAVREDELVRNSPMRKTIARRLLQSHTDIPVFFLTAEFDMQGFVDLRTQLKAQLPDVKVSYNDILIKAVAAALRDNPDVNAQWADDAITRKGAVDIGVAVALPAGLITPVVRNADSKSLSQIAGEVRELAGRAKDGKLAVEEYTNGTFTISNLGMFGIEQFTAIINPPESAILAVGGINRVPVVGDDGELTTGWRMKVTMSCDHRVIDGAVGATFLKSLRTYVESPYLLLV